MSPPEVGRTKPLLQYRLSVNRSGGQIASEVPCLGKWVCAVCGAELLIAAATRQAVPGSGIRRFCPGGGGRQSGPLRRGVAAAVAENAPGRGRFLLLALLGWDDVPKILLWW